MSKADELRALQERKRQLDARIRDMQNALRREERKARNHALMVAGGLVMSHAPNGDWRQLDWDALAAWLDLYGHKISECKADELPTAEAAARLRDWERRKRDGGARGKDAGVDDAESMDGESVSVSGDILVK